MSGVVDDHCRGCQYRGRIRAGATKDATDHYYCCNFMLIEGRRRPCPAGTGRTVKVRGKMIDPSSWRAGGANKCKAL